MFFKRSSLLFPLVVSLFIGYSSDLLYSQSQSGEKFIGSVKNLLRENNIRGKSRSGVIIVVPESDSLQSLEYQTEKGVATVPKDEFKPHTRCEIIDKLDLKSLRIKFKHRTDKIPDSLIAANFGQLVFFNLENMTFSVDTFLLSSNIDTVILEKLVTVHDTCWERRDFLTTLGYSLLPGGGEWYKGNTGAAILLASAQVIPMVFAIHYNNERLKYLDLAKEAALNNEALLSKEYFDEAQDNRSRRDFLYGASIMASLVNIYDVFLNVKDWDCQSSIQKNSAEIKFIKYF